MTSKLFCVIVTKKKKYVYMQMQAYSRKEITMRNTIFTTIDFYSEKRQALEIEQGLNFICLNRIRVGRKIV